MTYVILRKAVIDCFELVVLHVFIEEQ